MPRVLAGQIADQSLELFSPSKFGKCDLYHNDYQYLYKKFVDQSPRPVLLANTIPEQSF